MHETRDLDAAHLAHPLLGGLNEAQREAVLSFGRPLLILSGAGSGKTRTIIHKIAWMIHQEGLLPWQILAVTFTNKAAAEMRERVKDFIGENQLRDAWIGTFHSICLRILRAQATDLGYSADFVVYDDGDQLALLGRILKDLNLGERAGTAKRFQAYIDRAKNRGLGPDAPALPAFEAFDRMAARVYAEYQQRLKAANAMDFGDLLRLTVDLFREHPQVLERYQRRWHYIVVDEFQDTNEVQYAWLRALTGDRGNVCVVGDDDQSIYSWRGARVENILRFPEDYPGTFTVRLERNYRSTANIVAAAGSVISHNAGRHPKTMWTDSAPGAPVELYVASTDREEAERITLQIRRLRGDYELGSMAVIYRTNAMSRVIEDALRSHNVPYRVFGGLRFYDRAEIKDTLAYLKLLANPADEVSFARIINVPSRKIGETSVDKVLDAARERGVTPLDAAHALAEEGGVLGKKLRPFSELFRRLHSLGAQTDVVTVAARVLEWSGYAEMLEAEHTVEAEKRQENLRELLASMEEFRDTLLPGQATVQAFLDRITLATSADESDGSLSAVTLMTVHAAKGLEFDVVFLAGLEQGVLPHFNSLTSPEGLEEERRLCYVAMTRARSLLHLSRACQRRMFGGMTESEESRFVREIPRELLRITAPAAARMDGWRSQGFSGQPGARWPTPAAHASSPPPRPTPSPQRARGDGERSIDRSYDQTSSGSTSDEAPGPGMKVKHPSFGIGYIQAIRGEGPEAKVDVRFASVGDKTVIARFLARA